MASYSENRALYLSILEKRYGPEDTEREKRDALTIMYDLFHDPKQFGSYIPLRKALNMPQKHFMRLETQWNKSGLSLREIADKIRSHWGWTE